MIIRTWRGWHELDKLYNNATSQKKAIYFSKLAVIELCGWIEETLDDIIIKHGNRNLKTVENKNYCLNKIVSSNYGFQYNNNIRPMLINLLGLIQLEKFETGGNEAGMGDGQQANNPWLQRCRRLKT